MREEEEQEGGEGMGEEEEEEEEGSRVERWERRRVLDGWESKQVAARKRRIVGKGMGEKKIVLNHETFTVISDGQTDSQLNG